MALTGTATGVVPAKARLPFASSRPATPPSPATGRGSPPPPSVEPVTASRRMAAAAAVGDQTGGGGSKLQCPICPESQGLRPPPLSPVGTGAPELES